MANLKSSKAVGNLRLNGSLIDNKNFSGFSGGLLKSTGSETVWDFGGIAIVNMESVDSSVSSVTISDIAVGDLVLFFGAEDGVNQSAPTGGWTAIPGLQTQPDNDNAPDSAAYYKIATGTSETASGLSGTNPTYIMVAFRGVDTSTPFDVNAVENQEIFGLPNSPSITTVTDGCLILSVGIIDDDNVAETINLPDGYERIKILDDQGSSNSSGTIGNTIAISGKQQFTAGSEDPPAFTGNSSDTNKGFTIALRPKLPSVSSTSLPYIKCVGDTPPAPTAITYVGGTNQENTTSDLTLTGLQSGDLVLFFSAADIDSQNTPSSGWTAIPGTGTQPDNDGFPDCAAFYKFSTGTSVTASNLPSSSVHVMIAFRGVDSSDPFGSTATRESSSGMPDPASVTINNTDSMVLIVGFLDDDAVASSVTAPAGYTLAEVEDTDCTVMTAYKSITSTGTEDPGAFGGLGDDSYKAYTLELKLISGGSTSIKIDNDDPNNTYFTPSWLNTTPVFSSGSWTVTESTIEVPNDGLYLINVNWEMTTSNHNDRLGPQVAIAINGTPNEYVASHSYMRSNTTTSNSSSNQSTLMELDSGDLVSVQWLEHTVDRDSSLADSNLTEDASFIEIIQLK